MRFSEKYGHIRTARDSVRESAAHVPESVLQCVWYDQLYAPDGLCTDLGQPLHVLSPGWWNREEGPDFRGAQVEFGGTLRTGDVEIHLDHAAWRQHGHHLDSRYDNVVLNVVLDTEPPRRPPVNSLGERVPVLLLGQFLEEDIRDVAGRLFFEEVAGAVPQRLGQCAALAEEKGPEYLVRFLGLAGEWRMLNKARTMRERIERTGADQAVYEAFMTACGFSHFKHHFRAVARNLPYERARQLGRQDPLLLETALLQIAGLLPDSLPQGTTAVPHFGRLRGLRRDHLEGLRSLPLVWRRVGVRPNNNPERRLAGAARFLAHTARDGLCGALDHIWSEAFKPIDRRRAFEALFPRAMGFWATHCTWTGKRMANPVSLIGGARVRSIIGNVFVPAALARARSERDRRLEEKVSEFFAALPGEQQNQVIRVMVPRVFGAADTPRLTFQLQQGLLQMHQDWCEPNPSCHNCTLMRYLGGV